MHQARFPQAFDGVVISTSHLVVLVPVVVAVSGRSWHEGFAGDKDYNHQHRHCYAMRKPLPGRPTARHCTAIHHPQRSTLPEYLCGRPICAIVKPPRLPTATVLATNRAR
jgi:hypothetical protein